ncbi:MAG TPA: sigma 54-interacting transcriptional regulator, partial [Negativicutes bacterium]|nr:sigma 54-interacting transcriptional regulator [Negativicutes bacterium]
MVEPAKKIALMTYDSESTRSVLSTQLNALLQDYAEILSFENYDNVKAKIKADLIVLSSKYVYDDVLPYIDESCPMIIARRTLNMLNIDRIFSIPKDSEVLIVNDLKETALDVMELVSSLGIDHFRMIPYFPGCTVAERPSIAITPGEGRLVPDFVKEVIDIGSRIIDLTTIVEILERLHLLDEKSHYISAKYMEEMIHLGKQLYHSIEESNKINEYLVRVLNQVNDGIIAFDNSGRITVFNEKSEEILKLRSSFVLEKNISHIIKDAGITEFLLTDNDINDKVFKINNSEIVISKFVVEKLNSTVCTLKDGKQLEEIESRLRHNLIKKGHIGKYRFEDIIGSSPSMASAIDTSKKIAKADLSILIQGESGTGKELFASAIHNESRRASGPFLAVNFSALPEDLVESELFGYEEGAFTGAKKGGKKGLFEQADKGTIFLDEIGDTSLKIQARLLRVLQEKEIMRVGGSEIIPVNVRVIAATNRDLFKMCQKGSFREDLYYRLKKLCLKTPPLRDRKEDIDTLVSHFLTKNNRTDLSVSEDAMELLHSYDWPGNVRELENTIEYMVTVSENDSITKSDLPLEFFNSDSMVDEAPGALDMPVSDREKSEFVFLLDTIQRYNTSGRSIGRKLLSELSKDYRYFLTEDQVRNRTDMPV